MWTYLSKEVLIKLKNKLLFISGTQLNVIRAGTFKTITEFTSSLIFLNHSHVNIFILFMYSFEEDIDQDY